MRVLITGGAGCLGSNLVERHVAAGHEVLVIDNFATGRREALPAVDGLEVAQGSIADATFVERCFARFQPTHVVHAAAAYKDPDNWVEDALTNVLGAIHIGDAAQRHGVRRLVNFQTVLCYGRPQHVPIGIDHPVQPFTSYGISKTAAEQYLMMLADVPVVSLRLANVTGPRLAIGPIPTFYKRLKAGQSCFCSDTTRDFLDMDDFLAVTDAALDDDAPTGAFNVSTGVGHTIKDVFDVVVEHLGVELEAPVPIVPPAADDVPAVVLDPSRTEAELGWKAEVGFAESICRTLSWYDEHGVGAVFSHLATPDVDRA